MKQKEFFTCVLCKKIRELNQLEKLFEDGTPLCKICANEIRGSFTYYIEGKEVTYEEFKEKTKD